MRYTEIDGKRYEIESCDKCPFGSGVCWGMCCSHPTIVEGVNSLWTRADKIPEGCPLREVVE